MNFVTADSVLAANNQPRCHKPLIKSDWRILHDRTGLRSELTRIMFRAALPAILLFEERNLGAAATGTRYAVRPAPGNQVLAAIVLISEVQDRFLKSAGF